MNARVIAARRRQDVVIVARVRDLAADIRRRAVDHGGSASVHQAVDEGRVRVLKIC